MGNGKQLTSTCFPGDACCADKSATEHGYSWDIPGDYTVSVCATNRFGEQTCKDSALVHVQGRCETSIPNSDMAGGMEAWTVCHPPHHPDTCVTNRTVQCDAGFVCSRDPCEAMCTPRKTAAGDDEFSPDLKCVPAPCPPTQVAHSVDHSAVGSINGTIGATVDVVCQDGYGDSGSITCQDDQTWTTLKCEPKQCDSRTFANSDKSNKPGVTGSTGDVKKVSCNTGFACDADPCETMCVAAVGGGPGKFSTVTCRPGACVPSAEPNSNKEAPGSITGDVGDTARVRCHAGFTGGGEVTCTANLTFSRAPCDPVGRTGQQVPNSNKAGAGAIHGHTGDVIPVECAPGHSCDASPCEMTCGINNLFANAIVKGQVTCSPDDCPKGITGHTGQSTTVNCDDGFAASPASG
eukprot:gene24412-33063_t